MQVMLVLKVGPNIDIDGFTGKTFVIEVKPKGKESRRIVAFSRKQALYDLARLLFRLTS
jgi:hypothetical protein